MYDIKRWFAFYSSQIEFVHQAGGQLQKVDNANTPIPEILLGVPWRHQTVIVSKCDTINEALFYLNKVVENNMSRTELESACIPRTENVTSPPLLQPYICR